MILSNDGLVAFHYRSYGTFFLHKIGSIISIGDLPTTNIIEPNNQLYTLSLLFKEPLKGDFLVSKDKTALKIDNWEFKDFSLLSFSYNKKKI
ncbi:hypothetical protein AXE83_02800 [Streptococcus sp. oral taxon 431]|nr:hypothetical protein AXE83_02800 [Streptococcus sp. oral taxon 431]